MPLSLLRRIPGVLSAGLLAASCLAGRAEDVKGPDAPGGHLPPGARQRLGTDRLQHGGPVLALTFSHDGKTLASAARDHTVRLWDVSTGRERLRLRHEWVLRIALSSDGRLLASGGEDGTLCLWETATGKLLRRLEAHHAPVLCLAFSPDGPSLLSGSTDHTACLWDTARGAQTLLLAKHTAPVRGVAFAPGGILVTAGKGVHLWKTSGEALRTIAKDESVVCLALAPDGKSLAGSDGQDIRVWDLATGRARAERKGERTSIAALTFTPDGNTLVSSDADGTLRMWPALKGREIRTIVRPMSRDGAGALALSPDGKTMACAGADNNIELRETATGKLLPQKGQEPVRAFRAGSADGRRVATASRTGPVHLWDVGGGREQGRLGKDGTGGVAVALAPGGKVLAACGEEGAVLLWDVQERKEIRTLRPRENGKPRQLCFSPDGKLLAVSCAGKDGEDVQLFSVPAGLPGRQFPVSAVLAGIAFSPDGKLLALGSEGKGVRTWDVAGGKLVREYGASAGTGSSPAFSPDGQVLAAGGLDGVITLFDVPTGEALRHLAGHDSAVRALAFSPDGWLLASGGDDAVVGLWEVASGRAVRRFSGHAGPVRFVTFQASGRGILSAGDDATVLLWDLTGRPPGGQRATPPSVAELRQLWQELGNLDAARAYRAVWRLGSYPDQAVKMLHEGLKPVLGIDAARIDRLIAQLDHDRFVMREKASAALQSLGELAGPALRKAQQKKNNPEVARRLAELVSRLGANPRFLEEERLRRLRALAALEQGGSAEARKVLEEVARGAAEEGLRQAARAALRRLTRAGS